MDFFLSNESIIMSLFLGIGIAASSGFRVFLPLFALSIAAYFNFIPLAEDWAWAGSLPVVIALAVATVVEITAYLIPWLDNVLDTISIPLASIAGTLAVASTLTNMNPFYTWALAIIAGAGAATAIKTSNSGVRLLSTASTAGVANPLITTVETIISVILSAIAIFLPFLAFIIVLGLIAGVFYIFRKIRRKKDKGELKQPESITT